MFGCTVKVLPHHWKINHSVEQGVRQCAVGVPGFRWWLWSRDGGLTVMSLQLHFHCDSLLILLTHTQLLLSPENKRNTHEITCKEKINHV